MDKKAQAYWKEFESNLEIPLLIANTKAETIKASGWTERDGDTPGVFSDKRQGERCLWSVKWSTSRGVLIPDNWLPSEYMRLDEILAEMRDCIYRNPTDHMTGELVRRYMELDESHNPDYWRQQTIKILLEMRPGYPEYCAKWDMPSRDSQSFQLMRLAIRPGWGIKADYGF